MYDDFTLPDGLLELRDTLEEAWPTISAGIRASGVPTNEVPELAADDPGAQDLAAGAAAGTATTGDEPAAEEPAAATVEPVPEPGPQFDALAFEALQERVVAAEAREQQLIAALEQRLSGPAGGDPAAAGMPAAEEFYDEYGNFRVDKLLGAIRSEVAGAFQPLQEQITAAQAEAAAAQREEHYTDLVQTMIDDNISRHGDLASSEQGQTTALDLLESRAMQLLPGLNAQYGRNPDGSTRPGVLEKAIEQAASELRAFSGLTGEAALTAERNRLGDLAGQHGEPGPGGGGATEAPVVKINERVSDRYAAAGR